MTEPGCIECGRLMRRAPLLGIPWPRGYWFDQAWTCGERCLRMAVRDWVGRSLEFPFTELDSTHRVRIGALLVQKGLITGSQLADALEWQRSHGGALGAVVIRMGFCTEAQLTAALSEQQGVPWVGEVKLPVGQPYCLEIPRRLSEDFRVFPFDFDARTSTLMLAARSPVKIHLGHLIRKMLGYDVRIFLVQDGSFDRVFADYLALPRRDREICIESTRNARQITDFLIRQLQRNRGKSLQLGSYDRGFWGRVQLKRQRLDCFVTVRKAEDFAARSGQTLPEAVASAR